MKIFFRKRNNKFYALLIRAWTGGPYSHVELQFSDGKAFSSDEADNGARFKDIAFTTDQWDCLTLPMDAHTENLVRVFCVAEKGSPYDWRGISFSFLPIPIGWQHPNRWFCSEVCAAAIQIAGYVRGHTPASLSPNGLYKLLKKELGVRHGEG